MTKIISTSTTWSGDVTLTDDVQVAAGVTLTISPGAIVHGDGHVIQTFGTLDAAGTAAVPETLRNVVFALTPDHDHPGSIAIDHAVLDGGSFLAPTGNAAYGAWSLTNSVVENLPYIYVWYPTGDVAINHDFFINSGGLSIGTDGSVTVAVDHDTFSGWTTNSESTAAVENWASYDTSRTLVSDNNFLDTGKIALELLPGYSPAALTSSGNYFGTSDLLLVPAMIYDKNVDLRSAGVIPNSDVQTSPVAGAPLTGAPLSITGTVSGQTGADISRIAPLRSVIITDPNIGQTETITVTLSASANGTLTNLDGGSYDRVAGLYSVAGSSAVVTAAVDGLVFEPTAHQVPAGETVATGFTLTVTDSAGVSATDATSSVITIGAATPVISGTRAEQQVSGQLPASPFSGVRISDPNFLGNSGLNANPTITATVTLSDASHGALANLGGGSYNTASGVYTVSGSQGDVQAAVDGLKFTPAPIPVGQPVTTGFTIAVADSLGARATDSTTSIIASVLAPSVQPSNFFLADTTTGQASTATGTPYIGPVSGLETQYIDLSPDNLNIAASVPNTFIHSGSGNDAIAAMAGTNVLDGGTGSNFLTAGTGTDTFFVDDRGPGADIWTTVSSFHTGDAATVWGITPSDFNLAWIDNQGAAGYTGLTLHATANGKPTASLTLPGYSQNDLGDGRLSVSFGNIGGDTPYMYVQAIG